MTTIYLGTRDHSGVAYAHKLVDGRVVKLRPRLDLENHSPTGFEWGYGGSGPAQLALALLADVLGNDERAVRLHQPFKWRVTARLLTDRVWRLTTDEILQHVIALERLNIGTVKDLSS